MGAKIAGYIVALRLLRHGPARPDHRHHQTGKSEFAETDGPVKPCHDVYATCDIIGGAILTPIATAPWLETVMARRYVRTGPSVSPNR